MKKKILLSGLLLLTAGCGSVRYQNTVSPVDPSDPAAPQGAVQSDEPTLMEQAASDPHAGFNEVETAGQPVAHPEMEEEPSAGAVYICIMHPEVVSDQPGECPICKMDLVLKEEE